MNKTKYLQGDGRWGRLPYPKAPCYIKDVGCGEVSIANILIEMEKYKNYTPATIQPYCKRYGSPSCDGTYLTGICAMMEHYGLTEVKECNTMPELWRELAKGNRVAVYLMGKRPGGSKGIHWTNGGHFVASVDYKVEGGKHWLYIKDPWTDNKNRNKWITYEDNMRNDIVQISVGKISGAKYGEAMTKDGKLIINGIGGEATIKATQHFFGTNESGIVSGQMEKMAQYFPAITAVDFNKGTGSIVVKALQKWLGLTRDGLLGQGTTAAWQKMLRDYGYLAKNEKIDGFFGVKSMSAWQKFLNDYPTLDKVKPLEEPKKEKNVAEIAEEVIDGKWGSGAERKEKLTKAGYDYDAVQNKVNEIMAEKVEATKKDPIVAFRENVVAWARKIAADNSFIYVHWKANDPKTKQCPICHNFSKKSKYHGWYCTRFPYSAWKHGGGLNIKCDNAPNNGKIDQIYKAKTDAEALRLARKYFKIHDIEVIRNNGKVIPQKKLKPADACYFFSGGGCQHAFLYIGNGKMIDANSLKDGIAVRKAMSCRVAIRYVGK